MIGKKARCSHGEPGESGNKNNKNNKNNKGDENETTGGGWRGRREPDGAHDGVLVC